MHTLNKQLEIYAELHAAGYLTALEDVNEITEAEAGQMLNEARYYSPVQLADYMTVAKPTERNAAHTYRVTYDGATLELDPADIKQLYETIKEMEN